MGKVGKVGKVNRYQLWHRCLCDLEQMRGTSIRQESQATDTRGGYKPYSFSIASLCECLFYLPYRPSYLAPCMLIAPNCLLVVLMVKISGPCRVDERGLES
jgi:hypothetical protein